MKSRDRIVELCRDADGTTRTPHAPFENVADAKFAGDLTHRHHLALVGERAGPRDHEQLAEPGQFCRDVFDHAVGEILLLGVA